MDQINGQMRGESALPDGIGQAVNEQNELGTHGELPDYSGY